MIMKKQTHKAVLYLTLGSLLAFSGCEEFMDRYPTDALSSEQIFSDLESAQTTIIAAYDLLSDSYLLGRSTMLRGSLKGADFFHFTENPNLRFDREYKYAEIATDAGYAGYIWNYAYKTIASCNRIESILPGVPGDTLLRNDMLAQSKIIKAICYSELLRAFCYPKWMADDDPLYGMGVPLLRNNDDNALAVEQPPRRSSLEDCYAYVDELLEDATDLIDGTRTGKYFLTEQALWALRARNYLYTERWELAADAAQNAVALGGQMIEKDAFIENMTQRFNDESIFEIYFDVNDNLGTNCIAYYAFKSVNAAGRIDGNSIGYGDYGASNAFINLFDSMDIRKSLFREDKKSSPSSMPGEEGYSARAYHKYIGIESELIHDVAYIRLPEVLLIAAEAFSEIPGNDGQALVYLNEVYSARTGVELDGLSGQPLKDAIFTERRRELALEGFEIFDYLRKGRAFSRDASHPYPLSIDPVNGRDAELFHRVVYPIPQPEMDANPNIRDQQNPGYAPYQAGI
jgi:hypothetical protein